MWELRNSKAGIAFPSKVRTPVCGFSIIKVPREKACYHLYHSGVMDNNGKHGLAIALSEAAPASPLEWFPMSFLLACSRLNGKAMNLIVISPQRSTQKRRRRGYFLMTFKIRVTFFAQETCSLLHGAGTQGPVRRMCQYGISWASLFWVRNVLMTTTL